MIFKNILMILKIIFINDIKNKKKIKIKLSLLDDLANVHPILRVQKYLFS